MDKTRKQPFDPGILNSPPVYERREAAIAGPTMLHLVRRLCEELSADGVNYCHWKSTAALERSMQGENDLDLLVSGSDVSRFTEILCRCGFKEVYTPNDLQLPGILNYFGFDQRSGKIVHVHAHYRLVLGHDLTKNFHIPIEAPYLASSLPGELLRVPAPEFELILFVIRMVIKHSTWDTVFGRQGKLSTNERKELAYLQARADRDRVGSLLKQHLPFIDDSLFEACLAAIQPGCPVWARIRTGNALTGRLKPMARHSQVIDFVLKIRNRTSAAFRRRILRHVPKPHLASGGAIIAMLGGDGAGKTTAVNDLYAWLSNYFETTKVHMGKPAWSTTTIILRGILKIGRSLGLYPFMRVPLQQTLAANPLSFPGYPWLIREICTARDRYITYAKARRIASNGGLVLCDRYPIPQIKLMDGPVTERVINPPKNDWLMKRLSRIENHYYQQITLPECLILLRVDPEVAVQRKPDEDPVTVRARSSEIWELDIQHTPAHIIDANRSKDDVLSELKTLVWAEL